MLTDLSDVVAFSFHISCALKTDDDDDDVLPGVKSRKRSAVVLFTSSDLIGP